MKRYFLMSLLLLPTFVRAQGSTSGDSYLKFLYPARVLSLGTATVADPLNSTSSFLNPASLTASKSLDVMFSQLQWIQDVQTQILNTSFPFVTGTLSVTLSNTGVGNIEVRDVPGPPIGTFDAHFSTIQLGYALPITEGLSVGASGKYLYDKLYTDDASGYGIDLGALYALPVEGMTLGVSVTNLGSVASFRTQKTDLPSQANAGLDYRFTGNDFEFAGDFALSRDIRESLTSAHFGAEATYNKLLSLRLGYLTGYDIRGFSAGLGVRYSLIHLDYAFVPFSQGFGDAHIITIGISL